MPIIEKCHSFLSNNATGSWYETYRLKNKDTDHYEHEVSRGTIVLRVELESSRAFYWLYNINDAIRLSEFVGLKLKGEAHEIIIRRECRLFYDIDMKLDEFQKNDLADSMGFNLAEQSETYVMEAIGYRIARIFKEATIMSLADHYVDEDTDLKLFDWMFTSRNRPLSNDGFKISLHVITNLMLPVKVCAAIIEHVKYHVIANNITYLDIREDVVDFITDSIDVGQCRYHGSLSLPLGTKHGTVNMIKRDYDIPGQRYFLTIDDQYTIQDIDTNRYNVVDNYNGKNTEAAPEFVKEALKHIRNVKDYSPRAWDLNASVLKRSTMFVKRIAPSMCSICSRTHDNDNTLFLIFNSEAGVASWKCARSMQSKAIPFFESSTIEEDDVDDDLESFASRFNKTATIAQHVEYQGYVLSREEYDDIDAFAQKHRIRKDNSLENIFDPEDRVPYIPKHRQSLRTKIYNSNMTSKEEEEANKQQLESDEVSDFKLLSIQSVANVVEDRTGGGCVDTDYVSEDDE